MHRSILSVSSRRVRTDSKEGFIPSEIGLMQNLSEFYVSGTNMDGTIPEEFYVAASNLKALDFYDNGFTGTISSSTDSIIDEPLFL